MGLPRPLLLGSLIVGVVVCLEGGMAEERLVAERELSDRVARETGVECTARPPCGGRNKTPACMVVKATFTANSHLELVHGSAVTTK